MDAVNQGLDLPTASASRSSVSGVRYTMSNGSNMTFDVGTVLNDKWVILGFIGKGGMGEVYRAHQLNLNRDVAIKVISKEWVKSFEGDTDSMKCSLERFGREVELMAQVRHPNVLQIFDHDSTTVRKGEEDVAIEYIAMEYVPGGTLRATMSEEGFHPEEGRTKEWIKAYFLPLLDGVRALHEAGIIHRDLKPENVLLDDGRPKIADFGLARSCHLKPITQSMDIQGTPPYMSPEHFLDLKRTDERTDIYALGKILYEAISGKIRQDQIPFRKASLSAPETVFFQELDRIIQQATAEERHERLSSVEAFKCAIEETLIADETGRTAPTTSSAKERPRWKGIVLAAGMILLLSGIIGGVGFLLLHEKEHGVAPSSRTDATDSIHSKVVIEADSAPTIPLGNSPAPVIEGRDGTILSLVHGGNLIVSEGSGAEATQTIPVNPFYMDKTKVTNLQFVEFLNQALPRIKIENGVVRGDGRIWLFLGEVTKGCEPIGFKDGRFYIKEPPHASCPILRVTAYGASAYAGFHGRRLPSKSEWLFVRGEGNTPKKASPSAPTPLGWMSGGDPTCPLPGRTGSTSSGEESALPVCSPVSQFKANQHGIHGLDSGGEWGLSFLGPRSENTRPESARYVILGEFVGELEKGATLPSAVQRHPWEAFEEVGFRCVIGTTEG